MAPGILRAIDCRLRRNAFPDPEAWRIKGSNRLGPMPLAVLRELWLWRETESIAANRPPFFVLNHSTMVDIAAAAGTERDWKSFLPRHLTSRRVQKLEDAVDRGLRLAPHDRPQLYQPIPPRRFSETEKRRFLEITRRRDIAAERLGIDPTLIASRATLSVLAEDWKRFSPDLMKWQKELLEK